jgi:hypothetical protein
MSGMKAWHGITYPRAVSDGSGTNFSLFIHDKHLVDRGLCNYSATILSAISHRTPIKPMIDAQQR